MGRGSEIVYCFKCAVRLTAADFGGRGALRFADFYSCGPCARALFASLSPGRQRAFAELIERTHAESRKR